jgi:hypothetical protein
MNLCLWADELRASNATSYAAFLLFCEDPIPYLDPFLSMDGLTPGSVLLKGLPESGCEF